MKIYAIFFICSLILIPGCNKQSKESETDRWKNEILETEHEFAEMAKKEGIPKAFMEYAADDVVLLRNNNLVTGKDSMKKIYYDQNPAFRNVTLTWKPDFVDVSSSGDLGYTYGKYTYSVTDSLGNVISQEGVFHTVWKRQPDGNWRFVWD